MKDQTREKSYTEGGYIVCGLLLPLEKNMFDLKKKGIVNFFFYSEFWRKKN